MDKRKYTVQFRNFYIVVAFAGTAFAQSGFR